MSDNSHVRLPDWTWLTEQIGHAAVAVVEGDVDAVNQAQQQVYERLGMPGMLMLMRGLAMVAAHMMGITRYMAQGASGFGFSMSVVDPDSGHEHDVDPDEVAHPAQVAATRFLVAVANRDAAMATALFDASAGTTTLMAGLCSMLEGAAKELGEAQARARLGEAMTSMFNASERFVAAGRQEGVPGPASP